MSYVYIPNSLRVAQLQKKNSTQNFRLAPKLTEAKPYLKLVIELLPWLFKRWIALFNSMINHYTADKY